MYKGTFTKVHVLIEVFDPVVLILHRQEGHWILYQSEPTAQNVTVTRHACLV